ncbi:SatD family protein [Chitinophaga barathri]|uniref:Uncharacterized protein n=1 Tax=Chitinophaga barathri TaxID=1647451 RepID=A0A3N4MEA3_9BACT|nr:SatD family protein [Chitinophaga barathri]RPD42302.1 hypothetical protein EG028_03755 [Chitinophaga barathri]
MKTNAAVITGDVIQSSQLAPTAREHLQKALDNAFAAAKKKDKNFRAEQYRGDSFQAVITKNPETALRSSLILMAMLWKEDFKARLAIGTGTISFNAKKIVTSDGPAFRNSGLYLDELKKKNGLISVATPDADVNQEWEIHSHTLSFIIERWSPAQAEAVLEQLNGLTQVQAAEKLNIRQPAVQQRLQGAGWQTISLILRRFEQQVPAMF